SIYFWTLQFDKIFADLFGVTTGIFLYSPLILLIPIAAWYLRKCKELLLLTGLGIVVILYTFVVNTGSAGGWGARFAQSLCLFWGIPTGVYLLKRFQSKIPFIFSFLLLNPFTFNGSFMYSAEMFRGELYKPELFMSLPAD